MHAPPEELVAATLRAPQPQPDAIHDHIGRIRSGCDFLVRALGARQLEHCLTPLEVDGFRSGFMYVVELHATLLAVVRTRLKR
ncbi:MAG TPA: hypothetical protein VHB68_06760 [Steroidobacteraceae bacterium]|nr:hypothetical protein [Steroidobacteraceae bacterium]